MKKNQITIQAAYEALKVSGKEFVELFKHGSLQVEVYKPDKTDKQQPHDRDEIYVIT
ncbi:MAG TPA: hypothetical protein VD908_00810 [Cytophagales bacterium]|nr:hypothetical protein [Cytophagales bacterium]